MLVTRDMKLNYTNESGVALELSFFSPCMLLKASESLKNGISSEPETAMHGERFTGSRIDPRRITLSGVINHPANPFPLCDQITRTFNPTLEGTLVYTGPAGQKRIKCRVEDTPFVTKGSDNRYHFEIDLIAHQPFWEDQKRTEYIAMLTKNLTFPLCIPQSGMCFGRRKPILETTIRNQGDIESGFRVIFRARGGSVDAPQLTNKATGQFIRINYQMEKGDVLEVANFPERKEILLNGTENGFRWLDIDSDFFPLAVGENKIGYKAAENTINLDVVVYYAPRFLGVTR